MDNSSQRPRRYRKRSLVQRSAWPRSHIIQVFPGIPRGRGLLCFSLAALYSLAPSVLPFFSLLPWFISLQACLQLMSICMWNIYLQVYIHVTCKYLWAMKAGAFLHPLPLTAVLQQGLAYHMLQKYFLNAWLGNEQVCSSLWALGIISVKWASYVPYVT